MACVDVVRGCRSAGQERGRGPTPSAATNIIRLSFTHGSVEISVGAVAFVATFCRASRVSREGWRTDGPRRLSVSDEDTGPPSAQRDASTTLPQVAVTSAPGSPWHRKSAHPVAGPEFEGYFRRPAR